MKLSILALAAAASVALAAPEARVTPAPVRRDDTNLREDTASVVSNGINHVKEAGSDAKSVVESWANSPAAETVKNALAEGTQRAGDIIGGIGDAFTGKNAGAHTYVISTAVVGVAVGAIALF